MIESRVKALERAEEVKRPRKRVLRRLRIHTVFMNEKGVIKGTADKPSTPCPEGTIEDVMNIYCLDTPHAAILERPVSSMSDAELKAELKTLEAALKAKKGKKR